MSHGITSPPQGGCVGLAVAGGPAASATLALVTAISASVRLSSATRSLRRSGAPSSQE
jgi:hypothetical protein